MEDIDAKTLSIAKARAASRSVAWMRRVQRNLPKTLATYRGEGFTDAEAEQMRRDMTVNDLAIEIATGGRA